MADTKAAPPKPTVDAAAIADDIALQRVTALMAAIASDPLAVANQFLEWQNTVRGAHALLHAVVRKLVGVDTAMIVPRVEHQAIDTEREELVVRTDPTSGDVTLIVRTKSRAERRAAEKAARRN